MFPSLWHNNFCKPCLCCHRGSEKFDLWHHMDNGTLWYYIFFSFMNNYLHLLVVKVLCKRVECKCKVILFLFEFNFVLVMWFLCCGCKCAVANIVIIDLFPLAYGCQFHVVIMSQRKKFIMTCLI